MRVVEAATLAEEESSWTCASCDTVIEDDEKPYCRNCREYWKDVERFEALDWEETE